MLMDEKRLKLSNVQISRYSIMQNSYSQILKGNIPQLKLLLNLCPHRTKYYQENFD